MKKILYSVLLAAISCVAVSCSNGDYQANPDSNANNAVNPITPLTASEFTWGSDDDAPFSADINGVHWKADNAYWGIDSSFANLIFASKDNSAKIFNLYLKDVWKDNLYDMEWANYNRFATFGDSVNGDFPIYRSQLSNSGGVLILQNDSLKFKGKFYFKGVTTDGKIVNITNGYFDLKKF